MSFVWLVDCTAIEMMCVSVRSCPRSRRSRWYVPSFVLSNVSTNNQLKKHCNVSRTCNEETRY